MTPFDYSSALGNAPTGMFSGLDPSASMGSSYGAPLGGGLSGQVAGGMPVPAGAGGASPINPMVLQMIMGQMAKGQQAGQPQQAQFQQQPDNSPPLSAPPRVIPAVNPVMLGRQLAIMPAQGA